MSEEVANKIGLQLQRNKKIFTLPNKVPVDRIRMVDLNDLSIKNSQFDKRKDLVHKITEDVSQVYL